MTSVDPNIFNPILGKDETVIETFKPNIIREVFLNVIAVIIGIGLIFSIPVIMITLSLGDDPYDTGDKIWEALTPLAILLGVVLVASLFVILFGYKKKAFCITNKRVIIRSGIIGTDFKTLEFDLVGGISVNVGLLDKLVRPNTGKISFASAASPVINNGRGVSTYAFTGIENPYDVYKRIKEIYDNYKENKKQQN